jgi:hypothetical protein
MPNIEGLPNMRTISRSILLGLAAVAGLAGAASGEEDQISPALSKSAPAQTLKALGAGVEGAVALGRKPDASVELGKVTSGVSELAGLKAASGSPSVKLGSERPGTSAGLSGVPADPRLSQVLSAASERRSETGASARTALSGERSGEPSTPAPLGVATSNPVVPSLARAAPDTPKLGNK